MYQSFFPSESAFYTFVKAGNRLIRKWL